MTSKQELLSSITTETIEAELATADLTTSDLADRALKRLELPADRGPGTLHEKALGKITRLCNGSPRILKRKSGRFWVRYLSSGEVDEARQAAPGADYSELQRLGRRKAERSNERAAALGQVEPFNGLSDGYDPAEMEMSGPELIRNLNEARDEVEALKLDLQDCEGRRANTCQILILGVNIEVEGDLDYLRGLIFEVGSLEKKIKRARRRLAEMLWIVQVLEAERDRRNAAGPTGPATPAGPTGPATPATPATPAGRSIAERDAAISAAAARIAELEEINAELEGQLERAENERDEAQARLAEMVPNGSILVFEQPKVIDSLLSREDEAEDDAGRGPLPEVDEGCCDLEAEPIDTFGAIDAAKAAGHRLTSFCEVIKGRRGGWVILDHHQQHALVIAGRNITPVLYATAAASYGIKAREAVRAPADDTGRIHYFASGCVKAGDVRGFARVGIDLGVSLGSATREAIEELHNLAGDNCRVFLDSGAYSEVKAAPPFEVVSPITDEQWGEKLAAATALAKSLGCQLYAVAPDMVGHQAETLERLETYADDIRRIASYGANLLCCMQLGELTQADFFRRAIEVTGCNDLMPALPCKKAATSPEQAEAFCREMRPRRLHLLGLGPKARGGRFVEMVEACRRGFPGVELFCDSVAIRGLVARDGKGGAPRPLTAALDRANEAQAETNHSDGGHGDDYTETQHRPSEWMSRAALVRVADRLGLDGEERRAWLRDPDHWLQDDERYSWQHVEWAIDEEWVAHQARVSCTGRSADAIADVFGGERGDDLRDPKVD